MSTYRIEAQGLNGGVCCTLYEVDSVYDLPLVIDEYCVIGENEPHGKIALKIAEWQINYDVVQMTNHLTL